MYQQSIQDNYVRNYTVILPHGALNTEFYEARPQLLVRNAHFQHLQQREATHLAILLLWYPFLYELRYSGNKALYTPFPFFGLAVEQKNRTLIRYPENKIFMGSNSMTKSFPQNNFCYTKLTWVFFGADILKQLSLQLQMDQARHIHNKNFCQA